MGLAMSAPPEGLDPTADARLRSYGFDPSITASGMCATVVARTDSADGWPARLTDALALDDADDAPLAIAVVPAALPVRPGAVAVLSPAGGTSSYELYVAAAAATGAGLRLEHLNGCGTSGSAVHSGIAGRVIARSAVPSWHETAHAHPERALALLAARPAVVVVPMVDDPAHAADVVERHPDADVLVVLDRARRRYGDAVGAQVGTMVELAFGIGAPASPTPDVTPARPQPVDAADPVDAEPDLPGIRASDAVHVRLTNDALELTNRTRQRLALAVAIGDGDDPDTVRAEFHTTLEPGEAVRERTDDVADLDGLAPPVAVMRHWSHESEEVYEGGRQRMLRVRVEVRDAAGSLRAVGDHRPGNGLDFLLTARDLAAMLGRPVARSVLPEPAPRTASAAAPDDLLAALEAAMRIGREALAARGR